MSERTGILSDQHADILARNFNGLDERRKQWAVQKLTEYRDYRRQNPRVLSAQETEANTRREKQALNLLRDFDNSLEGMPQGLAGYRDAFKAMPDAEKQQERITGASQFFAAHILNRKVKADEWDLTRAHIANSYFNGKGATSDNEFHTEAQAYLTRREGEAIGISGMTDDYIKNRRKWEEGIVMERTTSTLPWGAMEPKRVGKWVEGRDQASIDKVKKSREESLVNYAYWSAAEDFGKIEADLRQEGELKMPLDMYTDWDAWVKGARGKPWYNPQSEQEYFSIFKAQYQQGQADAEVAMRVADKVFSTVVRSGDVGGPEIGGVLDHFSGLNDTQIALTLERIKQMGEETEAGSGVETQKGTSGILTAPLGKQAIVAWGRMQNRIFSDFVTSRTRDQLTGFKFKEGDSVNPTIFDGGTFRPELVEARMLIGGGADSIMQDGGSKISKAQADELNKFASDRLTRLETAYKLRDIAQGVLNPLDKTEGRTSALGGVLGYMQHGLAESAPAMLLIGSPSFGAGSYILNNHYRYSAENELIQDGWKREDAAKASWFIGAAQTALDYAGFQFLKKTPLGGLVDKYISSGAVRMAAKTATTTAAETSQEIAQDFLPKAFAQDWAFAMGKVDKKTDWGKLAKDIVEAAPEIAISMLGLSSIGAMRGSFKDLKNADYFVNNGAAMRLMGLNPVKVDAILEAPSDLKRTMFMDAWKERKPIMSGDIPGVLAKYAQGGALRGGIDFAEKQMRTWESLSTEERVARIQENWDVERVTEEDGTARWVGRSKETGEEVVGDTSESVMEQAGVEEAAMDAEISQDEVAAPPALKRDAANEFRMDEASENASAGIRGIVRGENGNWYVRTEKGDEIPAGDLSGAIEIRDAFIAQKAAEAKPEPITKQTDEEIQTRQGRQEALLTPQPTQTDAIQEQPATEGVLRQERPELGLQEVGQGDAQEATQEGKVAEISQGAPSPAVGEGEKRAPGEGDLYPTGEPAQPALQSPEPTVGQVDEVKIDTNAINVNKNEIASGSGELTPTSIKNAYTDALRKAIGMAERAAVERKSNAAMVERARAAYVENPNIGRETFSRLKESGAIPTDEDVAILTIELETRKQVWESSVEELNSSSDTNRNERIDASRRADAELQELIEFDVAAGTDAGRALQARKIQISNDFSYAGISRRMISDKGGPLTSAEKEQAQDLAKQHQSALDSRDKAEDEYVAKNAAQWVEMIREAVTLQADKKKNSELKKAGKSLVERMREIADDERKKIAVRREENAGKLGSGFQIFDLRDLWSYGKIGAVKIVEGAVTLVEFTKQIVAEFGEDAREYAEQIFDTAKMYLDSVEPGWSDKAKPKTLDEVKESVRLRSEDSTTGAPTKKDITELVTSLVTADPVRTEESIMEEVTAFLTAIFPSLDIRQTRRIFTDYGVITEPNPDKIQKRVRELRTISRLNETLDRIKKEGKPGLKKGYQRDKATPDVRWRTKEIALRSKDLKLEDEDIRRRHASAMDRVKTRLRNEIEDLKAWIEKKGRTKDDKERKRGKQIKYDAEAAKLLSEAEELRAKLEDVEGVLTEEEKAALAERALDRMIEGLERQIEVGDFVDPRNRPAPYTNADIEVKRGYLTTLREEVRARTNELFPPTPKDAVSDALNAAQKSLEYWESVMKTGEKRESKPAKAALSQAEEDVRLLISAIQQALRDESRTPESERRIAALEKRVKNLQGVLSGDIKPKKSVKKGPENEREAYLMAEIQDLQEAIKEDRKAAKKPAAEEKLAVNAFKKKRDEYLARVREWRAGPAAKKSPKTPPSSPEIDKAREEMEEARSIYDAMIEERADELNLTNRKKRIAALLAKAESDLKALKDGTYQKKERREVVPDKELIDRNFELLKKRSEIIDEMFKIQQKNRETPERFADFAKRAWRFLGVVPLAMDLGNILRQSAGLAGSPVILAKSFARHVANPRTSILFTSPRSAERRYMEARMEMESDPWYREGVYQKNGVKLTRFTAITMTERTEEAASSWIEKFPVLRRLAMVQEAYLNQAKMEVFKQIAGQLRYQDGGSMRMLGNYVNVASGRAAVSAEAERILSAASNVLLAPNYYVSRLQYPFMGFQVTKGKDSAESGVAGVFNWQARKQVVWHQVKTIFTLGTLFAMAVGVKMVIQGVPEDEDDRDILTLNPRSPKFATIRMGGSDVELFGGMSKFIHFSYKLRYSEYINARGKVTKIGVEAAGSDGIKKSEGDVVMEFLRSRVNINVGRLWGIFTGEVMGEPYGWGEFGKSFLPLSVRDAIEILKSNGVPESAALSTLMFLGAGVSTYESKGAEKLEDKDKNWLYRNGIVIPKLKVEGTMEATEMTALLGLDKKRNPRDYKRFEGKFVTEEFREKLLTASKPRVEALIQKLREAKRDDGLKAKPQAVEDTIRDIRRSEAIKLLRAAK